MNKIYRKILIVIVLIIGITCFQYKEEMIELKSQFDVQNVEKNYIVKVKMKEKSLQVPLDEYLVGVVAGEMPVSFELEALKAQVVASRTFVMSRGLKVDNTTASQVFLTKEQMKKKWGKKYSQNKKKIEKAVKDTHNEVMTYHGNYISAMFFSSCNGKTNSSEDYFVNEVAYLKSVDSSWDLTIDPQNKRTKTFTKAQIKKAFGMSSNDIRITSYTNSGYVNKVVINHKEYSGREVREKLGLASSCFQIQLTSNGYVFTTWGSGHGVGMSQYGAQGMALEKKSYQDILHHYYKNIKISSI